ncbi:hypothetical protein BC830DRAFT_1149538, partial [Chytriomyces sp. MP71]
FLQAKKKDSQLAVDKRFSSIFSESTAATATKAATTDKYGRKLKQSAANDLKRFYRMEEEEVEEEASQVSEASELSEVDEKVENEQDAREGFGLIRGEGLLESSDEEDAGDDEDLDTLNNPDADAEGDAEEVVQVLGPVSRRFAAVNMDWDNIKARDLFKIFDAFRPKSGALVSVSIYKSEFGKERMEKEAREGPPKEIFGSRKSGKEEQQPLFGEEEGKDFDDEKLRQYQLDRLRYYYAVIECDSAATASSIHAAVDGTEFERSANVFNLQYVPDEMDFDDEPVEICTNSTDNYAPSSFSTAALQHSKATLTWDLDDPDRVRVTKKRFSKDELKEMDFKAYLASDSEESSGDEEELKQRALKYKSLVGGADEEGVDERDRSDEEATGDMEITFVPGLSENAASKLKKLNKEKEEADNNTVFQQERRKRKEKAKEKKALKDDDFFNDGADVEDSKKPTTKKSVKEQQEREKAELELVMFDESTTTAAKGTHFDMKDVLKAEKLKQKKKKGKK